MNPLSLAGSVPSDWGTTESDWSPSAHWNGLSWGPCATLPPQHPKMWTRFLVYVEHGMC